MPTFRYEARERDGNPIDGTIEAKNRGHALVLLREHDLMVDLLVDAREHAKQQAKGVPSAGGQGPLYPLRPISPQQLAFFFDQLARLFHAGVTPHDAFTSVQEHLSGRLKRAARESADALAQGRKMTDQLARYPRFFPPHIIAILRAGELSGALPEACQEIVHQCETDAKIRKRVAIMKIYIGIHILFCILVPPFPGALARALPEQMNQALGTNLDPEAEGFSVIPDKAGIMTALRPGLREYWRTVKHDILPWLVGICAALVVLKIVINLPALTGTRDWLALSVPVWNAGMRKAATALFTKAFELMQRAALPLGSSLREAAGATGNTIVAQRVAAPAASLDQGGKVTDALKAASIFSPSEVSLLATAEETGTLDSALTQLTEKTRAAREDFLKMGLAGGCMGSTVVTAVAVLIAAIAGHRGIAQMYEEFYKWMMEGV